MPNEQKINLTILDINILFKCYDRNKIRKKKMEMKLVNYKTSD